MVPLQAPYLVWYWNSTRNSSPYSHCRSLRFLPPISLVISPPLSLFFLRSAPLLSHWQCANHHICHRKGAFDILHLLASPHHVRLSTSQEILVEGSGSCTLSPSLILTDVYFVPSFSFNLLFVSHIICDNFCAITFDANNCLFQDLQSMKPIGTGDLCHPCCSISCYSDTLAPILRSSLKFLWSHNFWFFFKKKGYQLDVFDGYLALSSKDTT